MADQRYFVKNTVVPWLGWYGLSWQARGVL